MDKLTNWDREIALLLAQSPGLEPRVLVVVVKNITAVKRTVSGFAIGF
jgi:hypothetical protein